MSLHPGCCALRIERVRWNDGRPAKNATVTCSVLDAAAVALTGASAVSCTLVSAGIDPADDGVYEGFTSNTFAPVTDTEYTVRFSITVDSKTQTVERKEIATPNRSDE